MSRPVVVGPGVVWSADVCAELRPALETMLTRARRDRVALSADVIETMEATVRLGQAWERRKVPSVPIPVPKLPRDGTITSDWPSVNDASEILDIKRRAVNKRIETGSLKAVKVKGVWRIDPSSLGTEAS